jgi:hypothetical protein
MSRTHWSAQLWKHTKLLLRWRKLSSLPHFWCQVLETVCSGSDQLLGSWETRILQTDLLIFLWTLQCHHFRGRTSSTCTSNTPRQWRTSIWGTFLHSVCLGRGAGKNFNFIYERERLRNFSSNPEHWTGACSWEIVAGTGERESSVPASEAEAHDNRWLCLQLLL